MTNTTEQTDTYQLRKEIKMPTYPPRTRPVKKQEELTKREGELLLAIKNDVSADKLMKIVDKYRKAQLSLLKAKIHQFKENEFQKKQNTTKIDKLEKLTIEWADKPSESIINEVTNKHA